MASDGGFTPAQAVGVTAGFPRLGEEDRCCCGKASPHFILLHLYKLWY